MLRWLFIALIVYIIYRLIAGSGRNQQRRPYFTFRFGEFPGNDGATDNRKQNKRDPRLDQIEEAEFEDITEKDTTEKKPDT